MSSSFWAKAMVTAWLPQSYQKSPRWLPNGFQIEAKLESKKSLRRSLRDGVLALQRSGLPRNCLRRRSYVTP